jgi:hypothetical protein
MSLAKRWRAGLLTVLACSGFLGCEHPHYVVKHPDSGIVAIAEDTPELRAKAEKLMQEHLPGGYVVDAVRWVPIGAAYQTVSYVGPYAEIETHQKRELMLYYHAASIPPVVPVRYETARPLVPIPAPPPPGPATPAAPAILPADALPPQPIPVGQ